MNIDKKKALMKELYLNFYSSKFAKQENNFQYLKIISQRLKDQIRKSKVVIEMKGSEPRKFPENLIIKARTRCNEIEESLKFLDRKIESTDERVSGMQEANCEGLEERDEKSEQIQEKEHSS